MEDIWSLSHNLNIYKYSHIYREANKILNCLAKKMFAILIIIFGAQNFLEMFDNYCGISFNRMYSITLYSFLLTKKKKKIIIIIIKE